MTCLPRTRDARARRALPCLVAGLVVATGLAATAPSARAAETFRDDFERARLIEESPTPATSSSPDWWLNSGARFVVSRGVARTLTGGLPIGDPWRTLYATTSALDSDFGLHPQNLFRLLTRRSWSELRQEMQVRIDAQHLSASPERNGWSGILLFHRYRGGDDLYYAGLRVDGTAVIKKKRAGRYTTLARETVYPGRYDRETTPNLLPEGQWLGLRTTLEEVGDGAVRIIVELHDPAMGEDWMRVVEAVDDGQGPSGPVIPGPGAAGIRTDFLDVAFDDYAVEPLGADAANETAPPGAAVEPLGVFDEGTWLRDEDHDGIADLELAYGRAGDVAVPADYDGDGGEDFAVFRRGRWYVDVTGSGGTDFAWRLGGPGDVPVPADWDGDGAVDPAVFRPAEGLWLVDLDGDGLADLSQVYGRDGDVPVPLDWDDDGIADYGVFRGGRWYVDLTRSGGTDLRFDLGRAGDVPVPADWDGDGFVDAGVFRPDDGTWHVDLDLDGAADWVRVYGRGGDVPLTIDVDLDGIADLGVFRRGRWYLDTNRNGGTDVRLALGGAGDTPLRPHGWVLDALGLVP